MEDGGQQLPFRWTLLLSAAAAGGHSPHRSLEARRGAPLEVLLHAVRERLPLPLAHRRGGAVVLEEPCRRERRNNQDQEAFVQDTGGRSGHGLKGKRECRDCQRWRVLRFQHARLVLVVLPQAAAPAPSHGTILSPARVAMRSLTRSANWSLVSPCRCVWGSMNLHVGVTWVSRAHERGGGRWVVGGGRGGKGESQESKSGAVN